MYAKADLKYKKVAKLKAKIGFTCCTLTLIRIGEGAKSAQRERGKEYWEQLVQEVNENEEKQTEKKKLR